MNKLVIYKSSAGSGKTYTLVKEYLKLVLRSPSDYKHILAVTFTNKSAEEMKSRILLALRQLSAAENEPLASQLKDEGLKFNIKEQAQTVLDRILHDYSSFAVSTIDSFFHRIIRAFAKELKLELGYDVEMDTDIVLEAAVDSLISSIDSNDELKDYLESFVLDYIENDKGWNIEGDIKKLGKELFKERYYELKEPQSPYPGKSPVKDFIMRLRGITSQFERDMTGYSKQANEVVLNHSLDIEDFAYGNSGVANYLLNKINTKEFEPGKRVIAANDDPAKWYTKTSKRRIDIINAVNEGLGEILSNVINYYEQNKRAYITACELLKTIYIKGILNDLLKNIRDYRGENNVFLMSDTNIILRSVINDNDAPFIYEKAGSVYKHFLIDEFQDTSALQWYNLLPLIINCLSSGYYSMIVGDVKQSVYRWRGGNMDLLNSGVKENLSNFNSLIEEKKLAVNHRSLSSVVDFNNMFFKNAPDIVKGKCRGANIEFVSEIYGDSQQDSLEKGGYVNITFLDDDTPGYTENGEELSATSKEKALKRTYDIIKSIIANKYSYNNILILVQTNYEASEAAAFLFSKGIKVISSESLLLSSSSKIQFLINLLRFLADKRNIIARSQILYYYVNEILKQEYDSHRLFSDHLREKDSLFEILLPPEFINNLVSLTKYSLYEITEELIRIFGLFKQPDAFLQRFRDMMMDYCGKFNDDLLTFLEWWDENKQSQKVIIPEGEEAVTILTIHSAKGLEKPAVIIPFACWKMFKNDKSYMWAATEEQPFNEQSPYLLKPVKNLINTAFETDYYEEELRSYIDNLNLLYVAFTRASELLYAVVPASRQGENTGRLIKEILLSNITLNQKLNIESGVFEYGAVLQKTAEKKKQVNTYKVDSFSSSNWHNKLIMRSQHSDFLTLEKTGLNVNKLAAEALRRMDSASDLERALQSLFAEGCISFETINMLRQKVMAVLDNKDILDFYSHGAGKLKREILLPSGSCLYPDRLLIKDNSAVIIEFNKDNKKKLDRCALALNKAGYSKVDSILFDMENNIIVR